MADLKWYWYRLRAMSPMEMGAHLRRKLYQLSDRRPRGWEADRLGEGGIYPRLPQRESMPESVRCALKRECAAVQRGQWRAFGYLDLQVDDPPVWGKDYLAGRDLSTRESAFSLNHRSLPGGGDVKLIWELSRWHSLVRLAQASWVLGDAGAGWKCVRWLEDWALHNPPFRGWNWTSALETGMRLIQMAWIDALLMGEAEEEGYKTERERLWRTLLPSHAWFTWRYKTTGSSANNHLLGELAGLIVAGTRWPELKRWGAGLDQLKSLWEREVLAQFAEDGGNREQALNYQFFSWELCWHARVALQGAGLPIAKEVEARLGAAMQFLVAMRPKTDSWDYGDSDNAFVVPLFQEEAAADWASWAVEPESSPALRFWLGEVDRPAVRKPGEGRERFEESGQVVVRAAKWFVRWDVSELGYPSTAAHGHLDALHLSVWFDGVAMVIDPGTGAYYGEPDLRTWLASREAHNGPAPLDLNYPRRLGSFLWRNRHAKPVWKETGARSMIAELTLPGWRLRRKIIQLEGNIGWRVEDACEPSAKGGKFEVRWQLGPGTEVEGGGDRFFRVTRRDRSIWIQVGEEWEAVNLVEPGAEAGFRGLHEGIVSPAFRQTARAPFLKLTALAGEKPCIFATTFLASAPS